MSKSNATKMCKHCKAEIPAKIKVCPNCQKKQGGVLKWVVIGTVCIALCASAGNNSDSDTSTDTSRTLDAAAISTTNSQEPIGTPTMEPTAAPTPEPTAAPTTEPTAAPTTEPTAAPTMAPTAAPADNDFASNNNFNNRNNPEQQETSETYVLNSHTHKIHHPHCRAVATIDEKNYATSSDSLENLIANGYTKYGICF